ncbi:MAG: VanZ family protein [Dehalococcoidia bacterium]
MEPSRLLRRFNQRALVPMAVAATIGWVSVTMLFLGSSRPPVPNLGSLGHLGGATSPLVGHLILFGALGLLVSTSISVITHSRRPILEVSSAVLVVSAWGVFTEWYQTTVPGRVGSLEDVLVDVLGATLGALISWILLGWVMRRGRRVRPEVSVVRF